MIDTFTRIRVLVNEEEKTETMFFQAVVIGVVRVSYWVDFRVVVDLKIHLVD